MATNFSCLFNGNPGSDPTGRGCVRKRETRTEKGGRGRERDGGGRQGDREAERRVDKEGARKEQSGERQEVKKSKIKDLATLHHARPPGAPGPSRAAARKRPLWGKALDLPAHPGSLCEAY